MADLFSRFKDNLDKGVATVTLKSTTVMEINKCKLFIRTLVEKIDENKNQLGHMMYDMYLNNNFDELKYKEKCRVIEELQLQCKEQEEKIQVLKQQETEILGRAAEKVCECGETVEEGMVFCIHCGKKIIQ